MTIQYLIIGITLAACITYAAICIYRAVNSARKCKDFHCAGCAFYDKCKNNQKKGKKKFGGIK